MLNKTKIKVRADAQVERSISAIEKAFIQSSWEWEHWRNGEIVDQWTDKNLCTDEGLNHVLDAAFSVGTQITDWYILIYNTNTTPATGMIYSTKVFTESTHYSEANRPGWQDGGVAAKSVDNSGNKASFTMSTAETIYGAGLVGGGSAAATKGDSAGGGVLYNVSDFSGGAKTVASDDVLKVTVTLTIADA